MLYRNSGGYDRGHVSTFTTITEGDPVESHAAIEGNDATSGVVASDDPPLNGVEEAALGLQHPGDLNMIDFLPSANPLNHHIFFDGSHDVRELSQDLDWLFENVPESYEFNEGLMVQHGPDISSTSPTSTGSHTNTDFPNQATDPWALIKPRLRESLASVPSEVLGSSFFEPQNLRTFYNNYFRSYNAHFPIIHQATFLIQDAEPLLLVAMLTLGATLSSDPAHFRAAQRIHDTLRWLIFSCPGFRAPAPIWCLQALLLAQALEKMFSSRKHHEMSHIFHGSVITLMRRGSSYSHQDDNSSAVSSVERSWHLWIEEESSRRVAYFAFIMDAQHSSIFGHSPALSVSDIHLPLPCAEPIWNCTSSQRWQREMGRYESSPHFLPILRSLLSRRPLSPNFSPYARFVLLHGLFSVTKHMQARDLTASDIGNGRSVSEDRGSSAAANAAEDDWKEVLDRAIDTWSFSLLSQKPSLSLEAARSLHRMAHVAIHVDLIDFHTFAGAPSLTSNNTTRDEYARAMKRLKQWSRNHAAKRTLSHCILLIQETMFARTQYKAYEDNIALRPWCLYYSVLVLWTYGILTEGNASEVHIGAEEYLVHMLSGLMGDISQLKGTNRTRGLLITVRDALAECRWELLQEAHKTLGRLVESVPEYCQSV